MNSYLSTITLNVRIFILIALIILLLCMYPLLRCWLIQIYSADKSKSSIQKRWNAFLYFYFAILLVPQFPNKVLYAIPKYILTHIYRIILQICRVFHIFYFKGNEINWVVGENNKGNCSDVCNKNHPGSTCDETSLTDLNLHKAKEISISNGNQCRGWNSWNYGQGFSQCTKSSCCGSASCQYNCSVTAVTTACVISDGFNLDHSRICPCISAGMLFYRII